MNKTNIAFKLIVFFAAFIGMACGLHNDNYPQAIFFLIFIIELRKDLKTTPQEGERK